MQQLSHQTMIFSRIVARLEPPVLQRHCSQVFDDELQAISAQLREIAAAYARLEEVREAVATLENRRADVRRSASLMATVESTAQMQEELMERMRLVERVLHSRPATKLENEERSASEIRMMEERDVEDQTKVRRTKRRRRDSTSDDAAGRKPKHEGEREEEEQPEPASSRKKSKNKKAKKATTQHEFETTEMHESPINSSPSFETESEPERDHAVAKGATTESSTRLSSAEWTGLVIKASTAAQRLANAQQRPAVSDVTLAVDRVYAILETTQVLSGGVVIASKIAQCQFHNLMRLTIGLLDRVSDDPVVASLVDTILGGIYRLIARDARATTGEEALPDLRRYISELVRIREKTTKFPSQQSKPLPPEAAQAKKQKAVDWSQWSNRVLKLHRVAVLASRSGQKLKFAEISSFANRVWETLSIVTPSNVASMDVLAQDKMVNLVKFATRVFESPSVTKPFIPLLDRVVVAVDGVVRLHSRFKNLHRHSQKLQEIRSDVAKAAQRGDQQKPSTVNQQPVKASKKKTPVSSKQPKSKAKATKRRKSKRSRGTTK